MSARRNRLFSGFLFFLLFFTVFLFHQPDSVQAYNVQQQMDPTVEEWVQRKKSIWENAASSDTLQVNSTEVTSLNFNDSLNTISHKIVGLCRECGNNPSALDTIGTMMAAVYEHPPASAIAWTRDMLTTAGLATPAHAQGIGFAALSPFLPLWQATRNIAYSLLIVVMIVIGFMLIFRAQIDPHTVISVQAALPKVVFTILLITFSYPIVGLLVDIMYLSIALVVSVFFQGIPSGTLSGYTPAQWQADMMTGHGGVLLGSIMGVGWRSIDDMGKFWLLGAGGAAGGIGIAKIMLVSASLWQFALAALAPAAIILVVLALALLFVFIRLLMLLANAYIQILISLILGPLVLLNEAIPGRSAFKDWLFNVMANLSVFPATAMIIMFATFLVTSGVGGEWVPPFLPSGPPGVGQGFFSTFLGLSVIFISPNLVVGVKKVFQAKPTLPIGAGTIFSPVTGATQTGMGAAGQFHYSAMAFESAKQMFGFGGKPAAPSHGAHRSSP